MPSFFDEIKRRNVVRVGAAYVVVGWLVLQVAEISLETFEAPAWVMKTLFLIVALGFPFALVFAWAFELTPEGIKKTEDVDASETLTHSTGRKLDFVIIGALVVALGYFLWERQSLIEATREPVAEPAAQPSESRETVARATTRSIAVLPFLNMSGDREQEWFADGLSEEILNSLARAPDLLVAARTSSFAYKGTDKDVPTIADELGVEHVLEGSVRRGGDRLRITAQLIRADDGFHLWSETYDRNLTDVIAIQEDVAVQIAQALETALDPEALEKMMHAGTSSVPAFEAYLEGLAFGISNLAGGDAYDFIEARQAFQRAVEADPGFAKAWWELALNLDIQINSVNFGSGEFSEPREALAIAFDHAIEKAIEVESDPVAVLLYRNQKALREQKYNLAARLIDDYLEKRPNDLDGWLTQIDTLSRLRRFDELNERLVEFFDHSGRNISIANSTLLYLRHSEDHNLQRRIVATALDRFPDNVAVLYQAHRTLLHAADVDGASELLPRIQNSDMSEDARLLATLRQQCAERRLDDAKATADRLLAYRTGREDYDRSTQVLTYETLGDKEAAIDVLRQVDESDDPGKLSDFLSYGSFDPSEFPNFLATIAGQGVNVSTTYEIPYRCNRP